MKSPDDHLRKELGRITKASFGWGGYQDVMIGLSVSLGGQSWGVDDFHGAWGNDRALNAQWTEESRLTHLGNACMFLRDLLKAAKVSDVSALVGTPIEASFDGQKLSSWRVLTEVIG